MSEPLLRGKAEVEAEALQAALLPSRPKHWLSTRAGLVGREGHGAYPSLSAIPPPYSLLKARCGYRAFPAFETFPPFTACWAQPRKLEAAAKPALGLTQRARRTKD